MASNYHEQGPATHYLRSIRQQGGVFSLCGHVVLNNRYSTIAEHVTCKNCQAVIESREQPKEEGHPHS